MKQWWPLACLIVAVASFAFRRTWTPLSRARTVHGNNGISMSRDPLPSEGSDPEAKSPTRPVERRKTRLVCRSSSGCVEPETAVPRQLRWLLQKRNEDGSWGEGLAYLDGYPVDRVGMTGLVLLSFLGAGYAHTSKDLIGEVRVGEAIRAGIGFLERSLREDGTFTTTGDPVLAQSLAGLALAELYGMTGSNRYVEPARKAATALERMQWEDGSWGDSYPSAWAGMAVASAGISELPRDPHVRERAQAFYEAQLEKGPNLPATVGGLLKSASTAAFLTENLPERSRPNFTYWYWGSLALYRADGPQGGDWKNWSARLREILLGSQERDGHWVGASADEALLRTCLGTLCCEVYYRYANAFGVTGQ